MAGDQAELVTKTLIKREHTRCCSSSIFCNSEGDNLHGGWPTARAVKPGEGTTSTALVTPKKMVPCAEGTSRTPVGCSCTTRHSVLEHYGRKQEKRFYAAKKLAYTSTQATELLLNTTIASYLKLCFRK